MAAAARCFGERGLLLVFAWWRRVVDRWECLVRETYPKFHQIPRILLLLARTTCNHFLFKSLYHHPKGGYWMENASSGGSRPTWVVLVGFLSLVD